MQEAFLSYIWQFQQFTTRFLYTTEQEPIRVLQVGYMNSHAGADFQQARLVIGSLEWIGSVEIHVKSSDWVMHAHQQNNAYDNVILHVVWVHNQAIRRPDGSPIPTLVLAPIVSPLLLEQYAYLYKSPHQIPCQYHFADIERVYKRQMIDQCVMQRLERKASQILLLWEEQQHDWETVAYITLARSFGFSLNAEPFERLAKHLPLKVLRKHGNNLLQVEALLFGMAGFLEGLALDTYQAQLQQEYAFLAHKYQLPIRVIGLHEWKFLRLRPANFPSVRLAQLAALLCQQTSLFAWLMYAKEQDRSGFKFEVSTSDYWQEHYMFARKTTRKPLIGIQASAMIVINTVVPLMVAYSHHRQQAKLLEQALGLLENLPAEKNTIVQRWEAMGLAINNAFDSQGVLQWEQRYCSTKKCLACTVGIQLIGRKGQG